MYWRSPVRLETAPTGSGENWKLPKLKINLHVNAPFITPYFWLGAFTKRAYQEVAAR